MLWWPPDVSIGAGVLKWTSLNSSTVSHVRCPEGVGTRQDSISDVQRVCQEEVGPVQWDPMHHGWWSCNKTKRYTYLSFVVVVEVVVIFRLIRIQRLVYPLTLSFIPDWCYASQNTYITLNNSFANIIIPSQKLVTMSASFTHSNWITLSYYSSPKHKESAS